MIIDDKGGEIVYKDISDRGRNNEDISTWGERSVLLRWWKDNKGGVFDIGGKYDKGKGSIKILSAQVGGASSWTCMVHLNVHFICLLAWHKF